MKEVWLVFGDPLAGPGIVLQKAWRGDDGIFLNQENRYANYQFMLSAGRVFASEGDAKDFACRMHDEHIAELQEGKKRFL